MSLGEGALSGVGGVPRVRSGGRCPGDPRIWSGGRCPGGPRVWSGGRCPGSPRVRGEGALTRESPCPGRGGADPGAGQASGAR